MSDKLGFYELLQPYIGFGLLIQAPDNGKKISDFQDAGAPVINNFPGPSATLSRIVTGILDYLSVEKLHTAINENIIVYSGTAKFGGDGRANAEPPASQSITSENGQELSWKDDMISFRMTVKRTSVANQIDTAAVSDAGDKADLEQLNSLLNQFADNGTPVISDAPGNDFRLELLIKSVSIVLPREKFLPAKIGADGWIEHDPDFEDVVFQFPQLAFVLEQKGQAGNLDFSLKSWDSAGFDDPGDVDTARFFTLTPPLVLHTSRRFGFGIEKIVADFSDDITPPEILENFGIGDDFNGIWIPLIRLFISPGRTTGLAFSARGTDLLFDLDKGFSGELALDILNRSGKLEVLPVFYAPSAKTPLEFARGEITRGNDGTTTVERGNVTIPGEGEMHLSIRGSISPYTVIVKLGGNTLSPDNSAGVNRPVWKIPEDADGLLEIVVTDSGNHNRWEESVEVKHVEDKPAIEPSRKKFKVHFDVTGGDAEATIECLTNETDTPVAHLKLSHGGAGVNVLFGQHNIPVDSEGKFSLHLDPKKSFAPITVTWPATNIIHNSKILNLPEQIAFIREPDADGEASKSLFFFKGYPSDPKKDPADIIKDLGNGDVDLMLGLNDTNYGTNGSLIDIALRDFIDKTQGDIFIHAFASFENGSGFSDGTNTTLSEKRSNILESLIRKNTSRTIKKFNYGSASAKLFDGTTTEGHPEFRVAKVVAQSKLSDKTKTAQIRIEELAPQPVPKIPEKHPAEVTEPERPSIFRKLGFRVRFERDQLVLGEISGELDFVTAKEESMGFIKNPPDGSPNDGVDETELETDPAASQSGEQGVLDFKLQMSYDTATRKLTQLLALGFDKESRDGWMNITGNGALANIFGSLMVFAPIINKGIDSAVNADGDEAIEKSIIAGVQVAIAASLGAIGMVKFVKFTLYGIELSATEILPDNETQEQTKFGDVSFMIDYAVDFSVDIDLSIISIKSKVKDGKPVPTRVRYRGFGFRVNGQGSPSYESVFDTSKGFELGIAEPGALVIGGPLGPLLRVDSVRVARENPMVLETDLGINANLGVITIDTVRVRVPIDPPGIPTILPTGISVNIPGTLVGSGFLDIKDNGFSGGIDVTLVPLKLRIQAVVGLENLEAGERRITAFFLGLGVEFPAPIPLLNSGLGIYGFLGLFGMHYKRDENSSAVLPVALDWYYHKAKGEPHKLKVDGIPTWVAEPDRWSFGLGMVLGTMEGAFIINLKGMLVLELPGPRILIFVKAQILASKPPTGKPAEESAGLLAVVDINFQLKYISIGVIVNYEIKNLVKIEVPIDTLFPFEDIDNWHLHIGSINNKASAEILGIAKGTAYLMFDGNGIPEFPLGALKGFSVAAGIAASLVIGDEDSGLYAKVAGALDVGVSTAPLHFIGRMKLEGRIHLWFVSLGASAQLDVEAPEPLYVKGEVCGSIDLWLTSISGCVHITIGTEPGLPDPEKLATGLSLQSHSPALIEGQATDQPVDCSLALVQPFGQLVTGMPIDVIPVLQMRYPPVFSPSFIGLKPSSDVPTLPAGSDGWFSMGGIPGSPGERESQYILNELTITPGLPGSPPEIPITWWQPARDNVNQDSQPTDKGVNLALNSWIPVPFPRAYHRSQDQIKTIRDRFEVICRPIAPATSVLWTFNAHFTITTNSIIRLPGDPFPGYSPNGWKLNGLVWPDPPGTQRTQSTNLKLYIHEANYPQQNNQLMLSYAARLTGEILDPAKVIPPSGGVETGQALQFPFLQFKEGLKDDALSPQIKDMAEKFLKDAGNRERIVIETGDAALMRVLICANIRRKVAEFMIIRSFNEKNEIVDEIKLPGNYINNITQLPATWQDQSGPWHSDVKRVFNLLAGEFKGSHNLFLAEYKPSKGIAYVELVYEHEKQNLFKNPPPVILGVIEILTKAEMGRVVNEQHYQDDMVSVVVKSLEEGDKRPLFAPNQTYTVTLKYTASIRQAADHAKFKSLDLTQSFSFQTTDKSPERLNPWILAMVPENDADGFFTKDTIQFIFNDASAIQLFKAFGKTLNVVFKKANGNHPIEKPEINQPVLKGMKSKFKSPYASTMQELIGDMPCVPGIIETENIQVFSVNIPLERQTNYMMDIVSTPPSENPVIPLFRSAFTTSRYESAEEFANVVANTLFKQKRLRVPLDIPVKMEEFVIPDDTTPDNINLLQVQVITDADMETALLNAFGNDLPPVRNPAITLLWSNTTPSTLTGVLVDAPESLLRTRVVPVQINTPTPDDDVIQHFRNTRQLYMDLVENGSAVIERIIYTTGRCRALLFFKPGASGMFKLALRVYRHTLLIDDPLLKSFDLVTLELPQKAPWEL